VSRCLITGASGFIGGALAARLASSGWSVRCLVRASSDTAHLRALDTELVTGGLGDAAALRRATEGCAVVFHCAALVSDWATVAEITEVNVTGTENVLAAALGASVPRLVHVSTTDVYGHRGTEAIDESYVPRRFSSWYAETKLAAERTVLRAHAAGAIEAVVLRPATVYGPRSREVVGEIAQALASRSMLLIDGGRPVAGLVQVENVVDAAVLAAGHPAAVGQALNVTDGLEVTWRQFTDDLAHGLGHPPARWSVPFGVAHGLAVGLEESYRLARRTTGLHLRPLLSRQAVHVLGRHQRFSHARLRALGWEPHVGYAEGLASALDWLRAARGR
jgi:nucleoside-diphosphate-sugar epimerase